MESFEGVVVYGKRLGRTIGFPTANIDVKADWPDGVYAVDVSIDDEKKKYRAIMNIGSHPTAPDGAPTVEAHLLDFAGDLYGRTLHISYVRYMRAERRFASLHELKKQLELDRIEAAKGTDTPA